MPLVQAYQCPQTKKLFSLEQRARYQVHLKRVAHERYTKRMMAREAAEQEIFLQDTLWSLSSIGEIEAWFVSNVRWLERNALRSCGYRRASKEPKPLSFACFELDVKWSGYVYNSHAAPRGGVINWSHRDPSKPSSYPGYTGSVRYSLSDPDHGLGSSIFRGTLIHTGSGGGGAECEYSVSMFDDDWPGLKAMRVLSA